MSPPVPGELVFKKAFTPLDRKKGLILEFSFKMSQNRVGVNYFQLT